MKRNLEMKINTSPTHEYIAMTILVIIRAIALNFLLYLSLSALCIWVASLRFDFIFRWIYAVSAGIALMILSSLFSGSSKN